MTKISLGPDGTLALELPNGHTVCVPQSLEGLAVIRRLLSAQARSADQRIANEAAPTQQMVDAWLRANPRQRPDIEIDLEELGL